MIALAVVATIALAASSCGGNDQQAQTGATPKLDESRSALEPDDPPTLHGQIAVAVPSETNGWNPLINQWADGGSLVGSSMIEPLATLDRDGVVEPWLAEKWTHNADFTEWEITLKPDITYHNGQKLDSANLQMNLDKKFLVGLASVALKDQYAKTEITGPLSVKLYLTRPWAQFPASMAGGYMIADEMMAREDYGVLTPIGTGPFQFVSWEQHKSLKVRRNDNYWRKDARGNQLPYLDAIDFRPIVEDGQRQRALQAGDVDMALSASATLLAELQDQFTVLRDYTAERTFVMLNTDPADKANPFSNVHARRALAYATDRSMVGELIGPDVQLTTSGYRPDSKWGLPEDQTGYYDYSVEKAKEEVAKYKADTGATRFEFTLSGLTNLQDVAVMQALQAQWAEAGIDVHIDNLDQAKYIITVAVGKFQAAWWRWYGTPNPDYNYTFHSKTTINPTGQLSINFSHYTSPTLEANLDIIHNTEDFDAREKANDAVSREINDQAVYIWLFDTPYSIIAAKQVRGLNNFRTHSFGNFDAKPWWGDVWVSA